MGDDLARVEYWLENTRGVLDEILCPTVDYFRCTASLLKEEALHWWLTLTTVVSKKWKYVSKRYLDKKKYEFLELKLGNKSVA
ncbi:Hexaprenyldihydroxybenzoate methyltransferase, mitochondrial-like protein [Gossypium australe]|uniref:Hexaprenyldihydroxybenzoate methyltransferase, mitochondrial-like protein n=1 Tax=Gossypium australe TaxID=47621 RepID=A0A5B6VMB6_9ROSI|nr:Hexaprenyldihydroxybenzoate methyltransferase, mitochondrial-like protein [Gossypium australe]